MMPIPIQFGPIGRMRRISDHTNHPQRQRAQAQAARSLACHALRGASLRAA